MPSRQSFRKGVESALHARDHIGVQDFVLLEDFKSEDAFLENLRKRFKSDLIYVSTARCISCICELAKLVCGVQCANPLFT